MNIVMTTNQCTCRSLSEKKKLKSASIIPAQFHTRGREEVNLVAMYSLHLQFLYNLIAGRNTHDFRVQIMSLQSTVIFGMTWAKLPYFRVCFLPLKHEIMMIILCALSLYKQTITIPTLKSSVIFMVEGNNTK